MGKHFGNLQKLKGITYYYLSPYELKSFKGMITPGFVNTLRRFRENLFYIGIPLALAYTVYDNGKRYHHHLSRKNPDDYKDDV